MHLKSLYFYNFRLYPEAYFEFSPSLNVIVGPNASGKTSILEAIHFLATGQSFRTYQASHLIRQGSFHFYVEACFVKHGIEQHLKISYSQKEKKIFLNATAYPSVASLAGLLLSVVFSPDDAELIKGSPQKRREFLDTQLSQADPLYVYHLHRYLKAMRQRNCLLKAKSCQTIRSWEHEMALSGSYLTYHRFRLLSELQPHTEQLYEKISEEKSCLNLRYSLGAKLIENQQALREYYQEQYEKNRPREQLLAYTLCGPHKDDIFMSIQGHEARHFASEGQVRSCAATLRLAEWLRLNKVSGESPLMLLDDLNTSLDENRLNKLLTQTEQLGQRFITGTQPFLKFFENKDVNLIEILK